jgi:hypothetical protein
MSTFIEQCPGCAHTRCAYCPMESVKIRASQLVVPRTSPTAASSTMEAVHRNDLSMEK